MGNPIIYWCPNCQNILKIPEKYSGKYGKCKHCNTRFKVPPLNEQLEKLYIEERKTKDVIQQMSCPKCGKQSTEYDFNKWRCLHCQTKFIYEPPVIPQVDVLMQNINIENMKKDDLIYTCQECQVKYSSLTVPIQNCSICGKPICYSCYNNHETLCLFCYKQEKKRVSNNFWGCVTLFVFFIWLMFGIISLCNE